MAISRPKKKGASLPLRHRTRFMTTIDATFGPKLGPFGYEYLSMLKQWAVRNVVYCVGCPHGKAL